MSTLCNVEFLTHYTAVNPPITRTNLPNVDTTGVYRVITAFNECDQDVVIDYMTDGAYPGSFIVPKNGRSFTRVINGNLVPNSLYITAAGISPGNGKVFINLGN